MSPAPLRSLALVLAIAVVLAAAAATPTQLPPRLQRQLTHERSNNRTKPNGSTVGLREGRARRAQQENSGSSITRVFGAVAGPLLQLVSAQSAVGSDDLVELSSVARPGSALLSLLLGSAGASSGVFNNPGYANPAESSDEVKDLVV